MDPSGISKITGSGPVFPFILENGALPLKTGTELLEAKLKIALAWPQATRFMKGEYGSFFYKLLHEPNDQILFALVKQYTVDVINHWEFNIELLDLTITERTDSKLTVRLEYKIKGSNLQNTLVFPYYQKIEN